MANCKKATRGAMGHLMKHYERGRDKNGEYVKFGNLGIDAERTHLNYNLAPRHDQLEFMQQRLKEVHVMKRKDVNVMCSWVVTVPKELPEEYHADFFECTYSFLKKRYSPDEKNIISAYVHMDEATPHMHFAFIPVIYDTKKKRDKVSAKEVVSRTELKSFHRDFQSEMDRFIEEHGNQFKCSVLNGATAGGNKSVEEYKTEKAVKYQKEVSRNIGDMKRYGNALAKEVDVLENKLDTLESFAGSEDLLAKEFVSNPNIKPFFEKYKSKKQENIKKRREIRTKQRDSVKDALDRNRKEISSKLQKKQPRDHDFGYER